jgi:uncharacterized damage-inducible protein DinB
MTTLEQVLVGKAAFALPANIIKGIPFELAMVRPSGLPHSLYEELWHISYWLQFSLALIRGENPSLPKHSSEAFPPDNDSLNKSSWQALLEQVSKGLEMASALAQNEAELKRKFRSDKTVADELIVIANHNAYHYGRMVALRQILGIWSADLGDSW